MEKLLVLNSNIAIDHFGCALTETAHNLEIKVIAINVETEPKLKTMQSFAIDGFQGYLLEKSQLFS